MVRISTLGVGVFFTFSNRRFVYRVTSIYYTNGFATVEYTDKYSRIFEINTFYKDSFVYPL